jgi:hypothetical protein
MRLVDCIVTIAGLGGLVASWIADILRSARQNEDMRRSS